MRLVDLTALFRDDRLEVVKIDLPELFVQDGFLELQHVASLWNVQFLTVILQFSPWVGT